ncbi:MAG: MBL fold metallo-hydrolase [Terrimicrobiaceae bacterium]
MITSSLGTEILVNPYAPGTNGRKLPDSLTPDVLLVTHERRDANYDSVVENYPATFRGSVGIGLNNSGGIRIRGTPTGSPGGSVNLVFSWNLDGMRICFPGDLAAPLSTTDLAQIGRVDVLFLPVSGRLGSEGREQLISQLQPRVIIPMGQVSAVNDWAARFGNAHRIGGSSVLLNQYALPAQPIALILSPQ